ncbi:DUF3068 domain-containing protein [Nocardioides sp. MAHUQ-72]|uniref:DUF3068 domain-containing protein n=1 Tax=unclassified Nocardioides TaxID=2615069 RepID=UPI003611985E
MKFKWLAPVLVALGAFLIVAAVVAQVWAPDKVKRTPIDVNTTTYLEGQADKLNPETGKLENSAIYAIDVNKSDSNKSDGDVAVFVQTTCVVVDEGQDRVCVDDKDPRLITAEIDTFATDRHTAESVPNDGYLPDDAVQHEGLVNKWPFDAQKQTYQYWEGTLGKAVDAVYERTDEVKGIEAYVYKITTKDAKTDVLEGVPGVYDDVKEIYVDPNTGSILNQVEDQQRYLEDGTKILDLQLEFTDGTQQAKVDEVDEKWGMIQLVVKTVPLVGYLVGIPVFLIGVALLLLQRRNRGGGHSASASEPRTPAGTATR